MAKSDHHTELADAEQRLRDAEIRLARQGHRVGRISAAGRNTTLAKMAYDLLAISFAAAWAHRNLIMLEIADKS